MDGFGFMLAFGDLAWVPFTYTLQGRYLVDFRNTLSLPMIILIVAIQVLGALLHAPVTSMRFAIL